MKFLSIEIEIRRQIKIMIKKTSFDLLEKMIKTKNFNIIPNKFSWILLDRKIYPQYKFKNENIKSNLGLILWDSDFYRNYEVVKKPNILKKCLKSLKYPFFSKFFSFNSNFTLSEIKLIDSYFQMKKNFLGTLPVICSVKNLYGISLSLTELLDILFRKLTQTNIFHSVIVVILRTVINNFLLKKNFYIKGKNMRGMCIEVLLRKKSE